MICHNPTTAHVIDYPIQDPKTREVKLWSIMSGETLDFPDYVGSYLLQVYGFLQRVVTQDQIDKEREEKKKIDTGMNFTQTKVVTATGFDATIPPKQPGYTTAVVKTPAGQPIATPPVHEDASIGGDVPVIAPPVSQKVVVKEVEVSGEQGVHCGDKNCTMMFRNEHQMKMHYASKHLTFS